MRNLGSSKLLSPKVPIPIRHQRSSSRSASTCCYPTPHDYVMSRSKVAVYHHLRKLPWLCFASRNQGWIRLKLKTNIKPSIHVKSLRKVDPVSAHSTWWLTICFQNSNPDLADIIPQRQLYSRVLSDIYSAIDQDQVSLFALLDVSAASKVLYGVPQGSVFGLVWYVLYTSDVANLVKALGLTAHLYADDTQLTVWHCSPSIQAFIQG